MKMGEEGDYIPNALPLGQTGSLGFSRSRSCSFESRVRQRLLTRLLTFSIGGHLRTSTVRFIFVVFLKVLNRWSSQDEYRSFYIRGVSKSSQSVVISGRVPSVLYSWCF